MESIKKYMANMGKEVPSLVSGRGLTKTHQGSWCSVIGTSISKPKVGDYLAIWGFFGCSMFTIFEDQDDSR